jgi:hypothetical protein
LDAEQKEANDSSLANEMPNESDESGPQGAEEDEEGNESDSLSVDEDFHWDRVVSPPPVFQHQLYVTMWNFSQCCSEFGKPFGNIYATSNAHIHGVHRTSIKCIRYSEKCFLRSNC